MEYIVTLNWLNEKIKFRSNWYIRDQTGSIKRVRVALWWSADISDTRQITHFYGAS